MIRQKARVARLRTLRRKNPPHLGVFFTLIQTGNSSKKNVSSPLVDRGIKGRFVERAKAIWLARWKYSSLLLPNRRILASKEASGAGNAARSAGRAGGGGHEYKLEEFESSDAGMLGAGARHRTVVTVLGSNYDSGKHAAGQPDSDLRGAGSDASAGNDPGGERHSRGGPSQQAGSGESGESIWGGNIAGWERHSAIEYAG
jgi:hypothetical protein